MTPSQVFHGIFSSVQLHVSTYLGLWEWVPYAFMFWYIFLIDWSKTNENLKQIGDK
jgi:hypothetical protein